MATLESFYVYHSGQTKSLIRKSTRNAVFKYLLIDKTHIIVGYMKSHLIAAASFIFSRIITISLHSISTSYCSTNSLALQWMKWITSYMYMNCASHLCESRVKRRSASHVLNKFLSFQCVKKIELAHLYQSDAEYQRKPNQLW